MKDIFPGYYRPTDGKFKQLWQEAIFVFDANVLLDIYRFSPKVSQELLTILSDLEDRIWLPHQFAQEYHDNLMTIYDDISEEYSTWKSTFNDRFKEIRSQLNYLKNRTQFDLSKLFDKCDDFVEEIFDEIDKLSEIHQQNLTDEQLEDRIAELFSGKVGLSYSEDVLKEKYIQGEQRYARKIPPGYKDQQKAEPYGDLIGWLQIIDFADKDEKPIILISRDTKEDWFYQPKGKLKGARPELVKEMRDKAKVEFYLYQTSQFMKYAREYLDSKVSDETIEEVTVYERSDDARLVNLGMSNYQLNKMFEAIGAMSRHRVGLDLDADSILNETLLTVDVDELRRQHEALRAQMASMDELRSNAALYTHMNRTNNSKIENSISIDNKKLETSDENAKDVSDDP